MPAYVERSFLITIQVNNKLAPPPAVLITGGASRNIAELFLPSTGTSCFLLPLLPDNRKFHTADNNILCGGGSTGLNCLQWSPYTGTWEELLTLDVYRSNHVSWTTGIGTYLMGAHCNIGCLNGNTTSLIKTDETQEPGFDLKYDTTYVILIMM